MTGADERHFLHGRHTTRELLAQMVGRARAGFLVVRERADAALPRSAFAG